MAAPIILTDISTGENVEYLYATDSTSPRPTWGRNQQRAEVVYKVPYNVRAAAARALLGTTHLGTSASGVFLWRYPPHFIVNEDLEHLHAVNVGPVEGRCQRASVSDLPVWEWAYLPTTYERLAFPVLHNEEILPNPLTGDPDESYLQRWVSVDGASKSRTQTVRGSALYFATDADPAVGHVDRPVFQGSVLRINERMRVFTWHEVPEANFPRDNADLACNACNSVEWKTQYGTFPAGTAFLEGYTEEKTSLPDGQRALNIKYMMRIAPANQTWQMLPDPQRGNQFYPVLGKNQATGVWYPFIKQFDFRLLFRPVAGTGVLTP